MGATFPREKIFTAETLSPDDLNAEFDNILNNLTPAGVDDASVSNAAHQTVSDPLPSGVELLPDSLEEEIRQLRYQIKEIIGETYWFSAPSSSLAAIVGGTWALVTKTSSYTVTSSDGVILASASGGAMTITLPAVASVSVGKIYAVKKLDTSTNVVTVDGNGSENIDGFPSHYLRHQDEYLLVVNSGTVWQVLSQSQMRKIPEHKNLEVYNKSAVEATTITVTADALDVEGTNGSIYRLNDVDEDILITDSGTNGLDTGAEAGNTTYAIWVIFNLNTNTVSAIFSTSFSTPTMPSGYTFKRLVGYVRNDSGSDFIPFYQHNEVLLFDDPDDDTVILSGGVDVAFTDIDTSSVGGDSTITRFGIVIWLMEHSAAADNQSQAYVRPNNSSGAGKRLGRIRKVAASNFYGMYTSGEFKIKLDSNLIFEYRKTDNVAGSQIGMELSGVILSL